MGPFTDAGVMVPVRGEADGFPGRRWRSPRRVLRSSWMEGGSCREKAAVRRVHWGQLRETQGRKVLR